MEKDIDNLLEFEPDTREETVATIVISEFDDEEEPDVNYSSDQEEETDNDQTLTEEDGNEDETLVSSDIDTSTDEVVYTIEVQGQDEPPVQLRIKRNRAINVVRNYEDEGEEEEEVEIEPNEFPL